MATKRLCRSGSDAVRASFKYSTARSQYSRALVQLRSSSSASNRLSDNNSVLFHRPNDLAVSMFRGLTRGCSMARVFAVIRQVALDTPFSLGRLCDAVI